MHKNMRLTPGAASVLIILQCIMYGICEPLSKVAFEIMPVFTLLSIRYVFALAVMLLIFHKRLMATLKGVRVCDWILPCLCSSGTFLLANIALHTAAATSVAFLRSTSVLMTPVLAFFVFRKTPGKRDAVAMLIAIAGLYLLCGYGGLTGFGLGEIIALISAFLMAGSLVFAKKTMQTKIDPLALTTLQTGTAAVMTLACALIFDHGFSVKGATVSVWLTILYLALGCTLLCFMLQNMALKVLITKQVALLQTLNPIMTAVFSFLILGELMSPIGFVGAALILAGVIFSKLKSE